MKHVGMKECFWWLNQLEGDVFQAFSVVIEYLASVWIFDDLCC